MLNTVSSGAQSRGASQGGQFTLQQPALPTGGGSIGGSDQNFSVSGMTGGVGMDIGGLTYSSSGGNGLFGMGFGAANMSGISRRRSNGVPTYDDDVDEFTIADGVLVPDMDGATRVVKGGYFENIDNVTIGDASFTLRKAVVTDNVTDKGVTHRVSYYRPRVEGAFSKIEHWVQIDGNDGSACQDFWRVIDAGNGMHLFGVDEDARLRDPADHTRIYSWLAQESLTPTGQTDLLEFVRENETGVSDAQIYASRACAGHRNPIPQPLVYLDSDTRSAIEAANPWYHETIYDYGQYELPPVTQTPYQPAGEWATRLDPHSAYFAGFEIRTLRLCRRVLSFIRFENELGPVPLLSSVTQYHYDEDTQMTILKASESISFYYDSDKGQYRYMASVPDEVTYTGFEPLSQSWGTIVRSDGGLMMVGNDFAPVDLHNEGIDGFLFTDGSTRYYYRIDWPSLDQDQGVLEYTRQDAKNQIPWHALSGDASHRLMDINADGMIDYVVLGQAQSGYYEYDASEGAWSGFRTFEQLPTEILLNQHYFVDIVGDGRMSLVVLLKDRVRYYLNKKDIGFAPGESVEIEQDDLPESLASTPDIRFEFAGLCGDGRTHLTRVTRDSVSYWPNLGYGRFGARVDMKITGGDAIDFGEYFRSDRIHFTDLDGDGSVDLVVTGPDGIDIYMNQCGNSFNPPIRLSWPDGVSYDDTARVLFADLKGNGTQCLVYCQTHPTVKIWFYDFCGGTKPYVMCQKTNNLGARVSVTHKSSVHYYLEDEYNGNPWITRAPFQVQVVSETLSEDAISKSTMQTSYRYRNFYWDTIEREFRGFGYSEHQDTMQFDQSSAEFSMDSPPALVKEWHHVGAINQNTLTREFAEEYFQGDSLAAQLGDSEVYDFVGVSDPDDFSPANRIVPDWNDPAWIGSDSWELYREAQMALKGSLLRREVYGLDGSDRSDIPYATSEVNATVKVLQDKGDNQYAVVQVLPREELNYAYERNPADPLYSHSAVLSFDEYGHALSHCGLSYPRRSANMNPGYVYYNEQFKLRLGFGASHVENYADTGQANAFAASTDEVYLLGIPDEAQAYAFETDSGETSLEDLLGYSAGATDTLVSYATLQAKLKVSYASGSGFSFADSGMAGLSQLVHWERQYFMYPTEDAPSGEGVDNDAQYDPVNNSGDAVITPFAMARVSDRAMLLPWYNEAVAFDKASIAENFADLFDQMSSYWNTSSVEEAMTEKGHYVEKPGNDYWWVRTGHVIHSSGSDYYVPMRAYDILGNYSQVTHDEYLVYATSFTDPVGNTVKVNKFDYQHLHPVMLEDANENIAEVLLDASGAVITTTAHGSETRFLKDPDKTCPNYGWALSSTKDSDTLMIVYAADDAAPGHYRFDIYGPEGSDPVSILYQPAGYVLQKDGATQTLTDPEQNAMTEVDGWMADVDGKTSYLISNLTSVAGYTPTDLVAYVHDVDGFDELGNFITYVYDDEGMESVPDIDDFIGDMRKYVQNMSGYFYYDIYAWIGRITKPDLATATGLSDVSGLWSDLTGRGYIGYTGAVFSATRSITEADQLVLGDEYQQYAPQVLQVIADNPGGLPANVAAAAAENYPRIFPDDLRNITDSSGNTIDPGDWQSLWQDLVANGHIDENSLVKLATWYLAAPEDLTLSAANQKYQESTFDLIQTISRIGFTLAHDDGFGRTVQAKEMIEGDPDCLVYDPAAEDDQKITANTSGNEIDPRWQTTGHVIYNNKGEVVKAYDPYFINTPEFIDYRYFDLSSDQTVQDLAASSVMFYDSMGRTPYVFSRKGMLVCSAVTPWQSMSLDPNDAMVDSPYFRQNVINPDTAGIYYDDELTAIDRSVLADPAKYENDDQLSTQGLAYLKTMHHGWTPTIAVHDNRGTTLAAIETDNRQFTASDFQEVTGSEDKAQQLFDILLDKGYLIEQGYLGLSLTMPPLSLFNLQDGGNGIAFHDDAVLVGFNRELLNCLLTAVIDSAEVTVDQIEAAMASGRYDFHSILPFAESITVETICDVLTANGYLKAANTPGSYQVVAGSLPPPNLDLLGTAFEDQTDEILKTIISLWTTGMAELVALTGHDAQGRPLWASDPRFVANDLDYYRDLFIRQ